MIRRRILAVVDFAATCLFSAWVAMVAIGVIHGLTSHWLGTIGYLWALAMAVFWQAVILAVRAIKARRSAS